MFSTYFSILICFLRGHSSVQQLLKFLSLVIDSLDNSLQCDSIYLNFKKVFDSVPHQELLFKLRSIGIVGSLWKWFGNYLTHANNLLQSMKRGSNFFQFCLAFHRGAYWALYFFAIYVNDLPSVVSHSVPFLFADDTKCVKSIVSDNDCCQFQEDLSSLNSWSQRWHLHFNSSKFRLIQFHLNTVSSSNTHSYIINGLTIESSTSHKDLGILLTDTLNW